MGIPSAFIKILSSTFENSETWFKKKIPINIFENQYRRITKPFNKGDIPKIKIKLPYIKQKNLFNIYDNLSNPIELDKLVKNTDIMCIIHIKGLKFLKEYFYCDCYITQIKLCQNLTYDIPNTCLITDDNNIDDFDIIDSHLIQNEKEKSELRKKILDLENQSNELESILESNKQKLIDYKKYFNNLVNNFISE